MTCFEKLNNLSNDSKCYNQNCEYQNKVCKKNCALNQVLEEGYLNFKTIAEMLELSKMRICHIEKKSIEKIKDLIAN